MGYIRHHAIVVTSWKASVLQDAHNEAQRIGLIVTPIIAGAVNSIETFLVGPDGSNEGWDESDQGDQRRAEFVTWLDRQRWEDGSTPLDWAEFFYGDDEGQVGFIRHGDDVKVGDDYAGPHDLDIAETSKRGV